MATTRKKSEHADKGKKKMSNAPAKGRNRPKVKDEACIAAGVVMTEYLYSCDDECCYLM